MGNQPGGGHGGCIVWSDDGVLAILLGRDFRHVC